MVKRQDIKGAIRELLASQKAVTNREISRITGLSRQAIHRHLQQMVDAGEIVRQGRGRGVHYLRPGGTFGLELALDGLEEDAVWRRLREAAAVLRPLGSPAEEVMSYAFCELANNAVDHSGGRRLSIRVEEIDGLLQIEVRDDGVGAFAHLQRHLGLPSLLDALQELSKGKVTTQPERHTGEGIFFVSKAGELFELDANGLRWVVDNQREDVGVGEGRHARGTLARFAIQPERPRSLRALFDRYTEDFAFTRTRAVVKLFAAGVRFVSRSEARRLLSGLDRFREVILDFRGVEMIGQGFADEVFRVWPADHRGVRLLPEGMNEAVAFMVQRASSGRER